MAAFLLEREFRSQEITDVHIHEIYSTHLDSVSWIKSKDLTKKVI